MEIIAYNYNVGDNAYVGYMYGTPSSSTYEKTHENINNSTIKIANDNWYKNNIEDNGYSNYVADAIYCNDGSIFSGSGVGNSITNYNSYNRLGLSSKKSPTLKCVNNNNRFTLSNDLGNGVLDYPVALIPADEISYGGGVYLYENKLFYLYSGTSYWTMSPCYVRSDDFRLLAIDSNGGYLTNAYLSWTQGFRPVISLKSDILFTGNGTMDLPFEVVS